MALGAARGKDAKLYRNTGTNASKTWNEVPNVRDLVLPIAWGEADVSTRESNFKLFIKTLIESGIEFGMVFDLLDPDYVAIRAAAWSPTAAIQFAIMNGDITTADNRGLLAFCQVFSDDVGQELENGQLVTVRIKPTRYYESSSLILPSELVVSA